jgi:hypothetical protein
LAENLLKYLYKIIILFMETLGNNSEQIRLFGPGGEPTSANMEDRVQSFETDGLTVNARRRGKGVREVKGLATEASQSKLGQGAEGIIRTDLEPPEDDAFRGGGW